MYVRVVLSPVSSLGSPQGRSSNSLIRKALPQRQPRLCSGGSGGGSGGGSVRRLSAAAVRRPRRRLGRRLEWWFGVQRLAGGRPHRPSAVRQLGAATRCGGSVRRLRRRLRGRLGRRLVVAARCGCSGGCSVRRLRRRLGQRLGWWLGERRLTSERPHRAPASRASNHHHPPVPHVEQAPAHGGRRRRWVLPHARQSYERSSRQ